MKKRYFWRRLSSQWFDHYLMGCGVVLNLLALYAVIHGLGLLSGDEKNHLESRIRVELANAHRCSQIFGNKEFKPEQDITLSLLDGSKYTVSYHNQGTYSRTADGNSINMVELQPAGLIFLEVDSSNKIVKCIPPERLECIAAGGLYESNGDCLVTIQLPSDCRAMNGHLRGTTCRVKPHNRILR